ncbi:porin family protein [Tardiphaga sp. vice352]|uniref:outer membrane protein n=1 Tax=unclassified Tardiphaga TaxID=2631404 RepID=UPI0011625191|nr:MULTISPECIES: outer membrane beta-barrel protein [unclassified Tardiphaga]QDM19130.1 porin family protein [Tardiphaga sp. vice278]QDM24137.1 porin family protein [Tardiphaga sp. vice154]QDM29333.1 porin family protein [Tardiphaga sp. vice304]QDM34438.1 porin family protein [Tardiphaga sp. vice352]
MRKLFLAASAIAALGSIAPAAAADLAARPYTKAPAMAPVAIYNWTGFYIGGHVGGDWNGNSTFGNNNNGRFIGGVQGGADYQFGQSWVVGIEANYSWKNGGNGNGYAFVDPAGAGLLTNNSSNRGIGSVTGRLGYTWGPALLYVKGGYGFRDSNNTNVTVAGAAVPFTYNRNKDGYTVGGGLEYLFTQNWSGKIEYQYFNFGNSQFTTGPTALIGLGSFRSDEHTVKAGLNYRFNWGGPVVAKY